MSARDVMMKRIARKAKKFNEYRTNSSRSLTHKEVIFKFFEQIEAARANSLDSEDFKSKLESAAKLLNSRMCTFDPQICIEIMWKDADAVQDWKDLHVNGVKIVWSPYYLKENPGTDPEVYVDLTDFLFSIV